MVPEPMNMPKGPKISNFSGNEPPNKGEINFKQWLYGIKSMLEMYHDVEVKGNIIWSLRGTAANLVRYLGKKSKYATIIEKLEL